MVISFPRTWISTGNASCTRRSNSSRWPSRPTMRWLPGTRILTWVGDGAGTTQPPYRPHSRPLAPYWRATSAEPALARTSGPSGRRLRGCRRAEAELVEPAAEVLGAAAHDRGEDPQVVAANRQHLPVEVLSLELDGGRVASDHRGVVVVDLVQADEVDGEAVAHHAGRLGEVDLEVVRALGQQLVRWHPVQLGEPEEPRYGDGALTAFVGAEDGRLELL